MTADLHVDPERLAEHARALAAVLDLLVPLPTLDDEVVHALSATALGRAAVAEAHRIRAAVDRAGRELADLAEALVGVSAATVAAEDRTREALRLLS